MYVNRIAQYPPAAAQLRFNVLTCLSRELALPRQKDVSPFSTDFVFLSFHPEPKEELGSNKNLFPDCGIHLV